MSNLGDDEPTNEKQFVATKTKYRRAVREMARTVVCSLRHEAPALHGDVFDAVACLLDKGTPWLDDPRLAARLLLWSPYLDAIFESEVPDFSGVSSMADIYAMAAWHAMALDVTDAACDMLGGAPV